MATAETWVMPLPIVPAPMIPIVRTGMGPSLLLGSDNHVSDRRSEKCGRFMGDGPAAADPGGRDGPGRPDIPLLHRRPTDTE
jgi:hypothetical protein